MDSTGPRPSTDCTADHARRAALRAGAAAGAHDLPGGATPPAQRMLGRARELARVAELLQECRFVTIVGPGGMGKTTLARALVQEYADLYPDGVRFIDLAVLAEGRDLVGALGAALGIARLTREGLSQLGACLRGRRMLIVFDCCEGHAVLAAQASEALLRAAHGIDILCTSREPLLGQSERIVRLGPIGVPGASQARDPETALGFPAVELFLARAPFGDALDYLREGRRLALVCAICRAVEGVPLALELAAALVGPLGLEKLAQQTSQCLLVPPSEQAGRGGRHGTLSNMLDWSYDLLSAHEQRVLRRLAVFRGGFTLEAAAAIAGAAAEDPEHTQDMVIELASKSLVSTKAGAGDRPRLLDLTREYAYDKLVRSGELAMVRERHARWLGALMDRLERDWMELQRGAWLAVYGPWVDDILAALDWALEPGGDALLGLRLADSGFCLGDQLGVAREFHGRVRRAVDAFGNPAGTPVSTMAMLWRLSMADADGRDLSGHDYGKMMEGATSRLQLARGVGSPMLQTFPLLEMWGWPYVRADYPASLSGARELARAAGDSLDPYLELLGHRTMAQSLHYLGQHAQARHCAVEALARSELRIPLTYAPTAVRVATSMRIVLARVLWMEGAADQALAMSEEAVAAAETDRPVALCQALCLAAAPVAIWRGELASAARHLARLRDCAEGHGLGFWMDWVRRFEHALAVMTGEADVHAFPSFGDVHEFSAKCRDHLVTFSPKLLADDAVARGRAGLVAWCGPELLRARALGYLAADGGEAEAERLLLQSLALARQQGGAAWALRSATSLAALHRRRGASACGRAILEPVLALCREGRGTADLRLACALMAAL